MKVYKCILFLCSVFFAFYFAFNKNERSIFLKNWVSNSPSNIFVNEAKDMELGGDKSRTSYNEKIFTDDNLDESANDHLKEDMISNEECNQICLNKVKEYKLANCTIDTSLKEYAMHSISSRDEEDLSEDEKREKYCSTKTCGERPLTGPHTTPLKSEHVEIVVDIGDMNLGLGYSKLKDMTIWDLVDANYWNKKKIEMLKMSFGKIKSKIIAAQAEIERIKNDKPCDKMIESNRKRSKGIAKMTNAWPLFYGDCQSKWQLIKPSFDVSYEYDGNKQTGRIKNKYEIMICKRLFLEGSIRIRKKIEFCNDQGVKFTNSSDTEKLIRDKVGEDSFRFQLAGPEVIVLDFKPIGRCRYIAHYKLKLPGLYHAHLTWTHEKWTAVNEMIPNHYRSHIDYPLGFEKQQIALGLEPSVAKDTAKAMKVTKEQYNVYLKEYESLPFCTKEDAKTSIKGSWILKPDILSKLKRSLDMFINNGKGKDIRNYPGTRAMINYENYMYLSHECKLKQKQDDLLKEKFEGKNLLFIGNSQVRSVLAALVDDDCDSNSLLEQIIVVKSKCIERNLLKKCRILQYINSLCVIEGSFGNYTMEIDADIVVSNIGLQQESNFHLTIDQQTEIIMKYADRVENFEGKFIWLEVFPMLYSKKFSTEIYPDWRTDAKSKIFNSISTMIFTSLGKNYFMIPSYDQVHAFSVESNNSISYPNPILNGVVNMLYHFFQLD